MKILGIETSCDETSVAVLEAKKSGFDILANVVSSQMKLHAKYGGVVPHLASREHAKNIDHVMNLALKESGLKITDIDLVAVTAGPGLVSSLIIGATYAKALSWKHEIPILGVNHMEGHIYSNWLSRKISKNNFPALCLVVSGGHTQLVLMKGHGKYKLVGETLDDAAGEAFDKIARIIGLGYPGGPIISRYAENGDPAAFNFPRPMLNHKNFNFSFSGLKTSVLYKVRELKRDGIYLTKKIRSDIAASAQQAIIDVLVEKTVKAAVRHNVKTIMLSGGVSANRLLRNSLKKLEKTLPKKPNVIIPDMQFTTDNAAMIAVAGYYNFLGKKPRTDSWKGIASDANWEIFS